MESPREKSSLIPGESYTVTQRVELGHMLGRGQIGKLVLDVGDVIDVRSNDPRFGLSFLCTKYPEGAVIVSPKQATLISVESV